VLICDLPDDLLHDILQSRHVRGAVLIGHHCKLEPLTAQQRPRRERGSDGIRQGADRRNKAIIDGIQRVGVRALFATGWSERAEIDLFDSVLMIENALHDCFSRRCAPLFTTAGLGRPEPALGLAGRPSIICPSWVTNRCGEQVRRLGTGPHSPPQHHIAAVRLADLEWEMGSRTRCSTGLIQLVG
jgi:hypothetical protein